MALDYSPRFDAHDARRKIGVITRAEIAGGEIAVAGFLYGRDFPEIVAEIGRPGRTRYQERGQECPHHASEFGFDRRWHTGEWGRRPWRTSSTGDVL